MSKKSKRNIIEEKMYPAVVDYFNRLGCTKVFADIKECNESRIHLPRANKLRDPDIVAINSDGIHIAEGKQLNGSTSFEECLFQLQSLELFGNYFYAFFPKHDWEKIQRKDIDHYTAKLRENGFGLMLVENNKICNQQFKPELNKRIDESKMKHILKHVIDEKTIIPQLDLLSSHDSIIAARLISALTVVTEKVIEPAIKNAFGSSKKNGNLKGFSHFMFEEAPISHIQKMKPYVTWDYFLSDEITVEIDPFGFYNNDGLPCIWSFFCIESSSHFARIQNKMISNNWEYILYKSPENDRYITTRFEDFLVSNALNEIDQLDEIYFSHRISIFNRSIGSLGKEIETTLSFAKNLPKK